MIAAVWWFLMRRSDGLDTEQQSAEHRATIEQERAAFDRERQAAREEAEQAAERRIAYEHSVRVLERRARLQTRDHYDTG